MSSALSAAPVTTSSSSISTSDTETPALTTTFTPPARCTEAAHMFTMLSSPEYYVWANEPMPVSSSTVSSCYPSEWIAAYQTASSYSSRVPAMSPLVCPQSWTTVMHAPGNYIACCPPSFTAAYPTTTVDGYRPMYGGTCYSNVNIGQTVDVVKYNNLSVVATSAWPVTATSAQVYAHPIDGYALQNAQQTIVVTDNNSMTASSTSSVQASDSSSSSSGLSGGAIAGIVIGAIAGLVLLLALLWLLLRRRKKAHSYPHNLPAEQDMAARSGSSDVYTKDLHEIHSSERLEMASSKIHPIAYGELQGADKAMELEDKGPVELEAGEYLQDVKR